MQGKEAGGKRMEEYYSIHGGKGGNVPGKGGKGKRNGERKEDFA